MRESYDLGVLFVHGIGAQRRGDTLIDFGEPLIASVREWLGEEAAVELAATELVDQPPDEPARTHAIVRHDGETRTILLAEGWWADSFNTPGWWPFAVWLFSAIPFVVFRATDHRLHLIGTHRRLDRRRDAATTDAGWLSWPAVGMVADELLRLVQNLLSVAITFIVVVAISLLGIVALVPRLRAALLSAETLLVRYVGDSYYLIVSPARADAMATQIEGSLAWLEEQPVRKVAILAHSQGAELVRRVLVRRQKPGPIASLITFGSGIAKLRAVARMQSNGGRARWAYALRVVAAGLTAAPVALVIWWSVPVGSIALLAGWIVAVLTMRAARKRLKEIVRDDELAEELRGIVPARTERWLDFFATSDPVPEGCLPIAEHAPHGTACSTRIANRRSPLFDHTSYLQNGEAFRPAVVDELARLVRWTTAGSAIPGVAAARKRRARLTLVLVCSRFAILAGVAALVGLHAAGVGDGVVAWLSARAADVADVFHDPLGTWFRGDSGHHVVAVVAILLAALALYGLIALVWHLKAVARAKAICRPAAQ